MSTLTITNTFADGEVIDPTKVNANFQDVTNWANGNVGDSNVSSSEKIDASTKLSNLGAAVAAEGSAGNLTSLSVLNLKVYDSGWMALPAAGSSTTIIHGLGAAPQMAVVLIGDGSPPNSPTSFCMASVYNDGTKDYGVGITSVGPTTVALSHHTNGALVMSGATTTVSANQARVILFG